MAKESAVGVAERVLAELEAKRQQCQRQGVELADARAHIALKAHTGDAEARQRLDQINTTLSQHASELASLDDALRAAGEQVAAARRAAAVVADRAKAKRLRVAVSKFLARGRDLDDLLRELVEAGEALSDSLREVHALQEQPFPTSEQLRVLGELSLRAAIAQTPWRNVCEIVAPGQRRSFRTLIETWASTLENSIKLRLGEKQNEEAA
jgi:chromosome segregation ATPase